MTKTLVLTALLFSATSALAQPAPPPAPAPGGAPAPAPGDENKAKAKALYDKGIGHYNLGEFDAAIAAFKEAYGLTSAPGLLFNIAQSFRLKKDYEQATYFYTTYLRIKPDAANRADVEARLQEMEQLIQAQKAQDVKPPVDTVGPDGGESGTKPTTTTTTTTTQPQTVQTSQPNPATTTPVDNGEALKSAKTLKIAGLATGGAGVALLATGFIFGSMASGASDDLDDLNTNGGTWDQDTYDSGRRNNKIAIVSFVLGGAAVVTGGVLYYLGMSKEKQATVAITPTPGGAFAGAAWNF